MCSTSKKYLGQRITGSKWKKLWHISSLSRKSRNRAPTDPGEPELLEALLDLPGYSQRYNYQAALWWNPHVARNICWSRNWRVDREWKEDASQQKQNAWKWEARTRNPTDWRARESTRHQSGNVSSRATTIERACSDRRRQKLWIHPPSSEWHSEPRKHLPNTGMTWYRSAQTSVTGRHLPTIRTREGSFTTAQWPLEQSTAKMAEETRSARPETSSVEAAISYRAAGASWSARRKASPASAATRCVLHDHRRWSAKSEDPNTPCEYDNRGSHVPGTTDSLQRTGDSCAAVCTLPPNHGPMWMFTGRDPEAITYHTSAPRHTTQHASELPVHGRDETPQRLSPGDATTLCDCSQSRKTGQKHVPSGSRRNGQCQRIGTVKKARSTLPWLCRMSNADEGKNKNSAEASRFDPEKSEVRMAVPESRDNCW